MKLSIRDLEIMKISLKNELEKNVDKKHPAFRQWYEDSLALLERTTRELNIRNAKKEIIQSAKKNRL